MKIIYINFYKYFIILFIINIIKFYSSSFRDSTYDLMSCLNSFVVFFEKINNPSLFFIKWLYGLYLCLTKIKCPSTYPRLIFEP